MLFDFWVIHKRKYDCLALYQPHSIYRYTGGVNWRAVVAFLVGVAPNLPGLINSVNTDIDVGVGIHPYQFGWMLGFVATTIVYLGLSYAFPDKETFIERFIGPDEIYDGQIVEGMDVGEAKGEDVEVQQSAEKRAGWKAWADKVL
jgi:cytosine/uracil/thiamine/allantoin permease